MLLDVAHGGIDFLADVRAFGQVEQVIRTAPPAGRYRSFRMIRGGFIERASRDGMRRRAFSSLARWAAKRTSAKRRKMRPRTGAEYSWDFRPELARNWSAASQSRFSSAALSAFYSDGAFQFIWRIGVQPDNMQSSRPPQSQK